MSATPDANKKARERGLFCGGRATRQA